MGIQFTVDKNKVKNAVKNDKVADNQAPAAAGDMAGLEKNMATLVCSINNKDDCLSCGS